MSSLDFKSLIPLFEKGESFEITQKWYEYTTRKALPGEWYLKRSSPLAKMAKEYGFILQSDKRDETRVVYFIKDEDQGGTVTDLQ